MKEKDENKKAEELAEEFREELDQASDLEFMSWEYRKKKLIIWVIRTLITAVLYYFFWEYPFVKWSLIVIVPLSAFNLLLLLGSKFLLDRKLSKAHRAVNNMEDTLKNKEEE